MINSVNFLSFVGNNYTIIKRKLSFWSYRNGQKFNEDVFHNTILNCNDTIKNRNIIFKNSNEVFAYIFTSYRTNLLRNKLYADNKIKNEIVESIKIKNENYIIEKCDNSIIKDNVINEFGEKSYNILLEHLNGETTKELQEKHQIKNMKEKIKKMKDYISNKFYKEGEK